MTTNSDYYPMVYY